SGAAHRVDDLQRVTGGAAGACAAHEHGGERSAASRRRAAGETEEGSAPAPRRVRIRTLHRKEPLETMQHPRLGSLARLAVAFLVAGLAALAGAAEADAGTYRAVQCHPALRAGGADFSW